MRLRRLLKLYFAMCLEHWFGVQFVIEAEGLLRHPVPWHWLEVELNAAEIVWLIHKSAAVGAREDVLFLNEVLERMLS